MIGALACGGDGPNGPSSSAGGSSGGGGGLPNGSMTALVSGVQWTANSNIVPIFMNGALSVAGESTDRRTVGFGLTATATGTYSTDNSPFVQFTIFEVAPGATAAAAWTARSGLAGTGGTVTLTTLTSTTAAGTFSFNAAPTAGTPATGTRTVTNGVFNVRF